MNNQHSFRIISKLLLRTSRYFNEISELCLDELEGKNSSDSQIHEQITVRKVSPNAIPKLFSNPPADDFIIYYLENSAAFAVKYNEHNILMLTRYTIMEWKRLSLEERAIYRAKVDLEKRQFIEAIKNYKDEYYEAHAEMKRERRAKYTSPEWLEMKKKKLKNKRKIKQESEVSSEPSSASLSKQKVGLKNEEPNNQDDDLFI